MYWQERFWLWGETSRDPSLGSARQLTVVCWCKAEVTLPSLKESCQPQWHPFLALEDVLQCSDWLFWSFMNAWLGWSSFNEPSDGPSLDWQARNTTRTIGEIKSFKNSLSKLSSRTDADPRAWQSLKVACWWMVSCEASETSNTQVLYHSENRQLSSPRWATNWAI